MVNSDQVPKILLFIATVGTTLGLIFGIVGLATPGWLQVFGIDGSVSNVGLFYSKTYTTKGETTSSLNVATDWYRFGPGAVLAFCYLLIFIAVVHLGLTIKLKSGDKALEKCKVAKGLLWSAFVFMLLSLVVFVIGYLIISIGSNIISSASKNEFVLKVPILGYSFVLSWIALILIAKSSIVASVAYCKVRPDNFGIELHQPVPKV